jgi:hypothetical protein
MDFVDLLGNEGVPLERPCCTWRELVQKPFSKLHDDVFTRMWVIPMDGVELPETEDAAGRLLHEPVDSKATRSRKARRIPCPLGSQAHATRRRGHARSAHRMPRQGSKRRRRACRRLTAHGVQSLLAERGCKGT